MNVWTVRLDEKKLSSWTKNNFGFKEVAENTAPVSFYTATSGQWQIRDTFTLGPSDPRQISIDEIARTKSYARKVGAPSHLHRKRCDKNEKVLFYHGFTKWPKKDNFRITFQSVSSSSVILISKWDFNHLQIKLILFVNGCALGFALLT